MNVTVDSNEILTWTWKLPTNKECGSYVKCTIRAIYRPKTLASLKGLPENWYQDSWDRIRIASNYVPSFLRQRGIQDVSHSSLLCIHIPNDDRLFPGRLDEQIPELGGATREWIVDKTLSHQGSHADAKFEVLWTSGDKTWLPYSEIAHLRVLTDYFEILGINDILRLTVNNIGDVSDDESNIVARCVSIYIGRPNKCCPVYQDTQVQRSTAVPCRLNSRDRMTIMERRPHNRPLRQPPVIPSSALPNGGGDIPRTLGLKDPQDKTRPGRVSGDGAIVISRSGRPIALATIDKSMNISALLPIGTHYIEGCHLGTARGHLPLT